MYECGAVEREYGASRSQDHKLRTERRTGANLNGVSLSFACTAANGPERAERERLRSID